MGNESYNVDVPVRETRNVGFESVCERERSRRIRDEVLGDPDRGSVVRLQVDLQIKSRSRMVRRNGFNRVCGCE